MASAWVASGADEPVHAYEAEQRWTTGSFVVGSSPDASAGSSAGRPMVPVNHRAACSRLEPGTERAWWSLRSTRVARPEPSSVRISASRPPRTVEMSKPPDAPVTVGVKDAPWSRLNSNPLAGSAEKRSCCPATVMAVTELPAQFLADAAAHEWPPSLERSRTWHSVEQFALVAVAYAVAVGSVRSEASDTISREEGWDAASGPADTGTAPAANPSTSTVPTVIEAASRRRGGVRFHSPVVPRFSLRTTPSSELGPKPIRRWLSVSKTSDSRRLGRRKPREVGIADHLGGQ